VRPARAHSNWQAVRQRLRHGERTITPTTRSHPFTALLRFSDHARYTSRSWIRGPNSCTAIVHHESHAYDAIHAWAYHCDRNDHIAFAPQGTRG